MVSRSRRPTSTKTRIETEIDEHVRERGWEVEDQHPLKQGLKHDRSTTGRLTNWVEDQHPLKQGLKQKVGKVIICNDNESKTNIH